MRTRINYSLILDLHYYIVVIRVCSYSMRYKIHVRDTNTFCRRNYSTSKKRIRTLIGRYILSLTLENWAWTSYTKNKNIRR